MQLHKNLSMKMHSQILSLHGLEALGASLGTMDALMSKLTVNCHCPLMAIATFDADIVQFIQYNNFQTYTTTCHKS